VLVALAVLTAVAGCGGEDPGSGYDQTDPGSGYDQTDPGNGYDQTDADPYSCTRGLGVCPGEMPSVPPPLLPKW
jgi:hypothetical protein